MRLQYQAASVVLVNARSPLANLTSLVIRRLSWCAGVSLFIASSVAVSCLHRKMLFGISFTAYHEGVEWRQDQMIEVG